MKEEEKYGPDVTIYPDGKYRWIYEMNLYTKVYASVKNMTLYWTTSAPVVLR